jgi:hypothetical protein
MPSVRSDASTKEVLFALSGDRNWLVEEALRAGSDQDGDLEAGGGYTAKSRNLAGGMEAFEG